MSKKTLVAVAATLAATGGVLLPSTASAQLAFNVGAVTDYRYRGISQTRLKPALQGGADYALGNFYVGAWASTIKWVKDGGGDADVEIDFYGGYKGKITQDLGFDVGLLNYVYPRNKLSVSPDTTELYGALSYGPATLKYSHSVTNLFGVPDSKNSGYLDLSATFEIGGGFSIAPHVGYTKVNNNGDFDYTDYSLTVSKDFSGFLVSAAVVGGDLDVRSPRNNKRLDKAGLVVGVKYNF